MDTKIIEQDRNWKVAKSNDLIQRSRYALTLQQQKMLLFMVSKVKPMDTGLETYTFDVREFCAAAGLIVDETGYYYKAIKQDIKTIADASAWIKVDGHEKLFRWIDAATLDIKNGSGTVSIRFHETVQPYLFELRQNYTQFPLHEVLPFQSKYTIRLYEILKSYAYGRKFDNYQPIEHEFTKEQLYELLDGGTYDRYYDFKKRALLPAVEEINTYSEEIHVDMIEQREGNAIKYITFVISHPSVKQIRGAQMAKEKLLKG